MTKTAKLDAIVEHVTPETATDWLTRNDSNRQIRERYVAQLVRDIRNGNWQMTGETIKFDTQDRLLDGQHRLSAVVSSGITVPMLVVRGVDPSARDVIDSGVKRTAGDALRMHGHSDAILLASSARWAYLYDEGLLYSGLARVVSNADILAYVDANPLLSQAVNIGRRAMSATDGAPTAFVAAAFLTMRKDPHAAELFWTALTTGAGVPAGSPILALTSRLRYIKRNRTPVSLVDQLSLILRAWNAWRAGRSLQTLPLYAAGETIRCPAVR